MTFFQEGKNCWRVANIDRGSFLIDANAFFKNLYFALEKAKNTVYIMGWDFHTQIPLLYQNNKLRHQSVIRRYFRHLTRKNPHLQIYILIWDANIAVSLDREFLGPLKLTWNNRRIHFKFNNQHPVSGSHHQKIIVIDDQIVFNGGMDLAQSRWDVQSHPHNNPLRKKLNRDSYEPQHDVQIMMQGNMAKKYGELFRNCWTHDTGKKIISPADQSVTEEYDGLNWEFGPMPVAMSRTVPIYKDLKPSKEIEISYLELISLAKTTIFIENQYLTSKSISEAIAKKLQERNGPEVIVIMPNTGRGIMENSTLFLLRNAFIARLQQADKYHRLGMYYPTDDQGTVIRVHSKLMIVDGKFLTLGSANLSNRSMGLDFENNILIDGSEDPETEQIVAGLMARLLAEHTSSTASNVLRYLESHTISQFIAAHKGRRWLEPIQSKPSGIDTAETTVAELLDMEQPFKFERKLFSSGLYLGIKQAHVLMTTTFLILFVVCLIFFLLWMQLIRW